MLVTRALGSYDSSFIRYLSLTQADVVSITVTGWLDPGISATGTVLNEFFSNAHRSVT